MVYVSKALNNSYFQYKIISKQCKVSQNISVAVVVFVVVIVAVVCGEDSFDAKQ